MQRIGALRKWLRRVCWALLVILLLAAGAVCLPWEPPGLRKGIQRSLGRRLGYPVRISRASVWPIRGELKLKRIRVYGVSTGPGTRSRSTGEPIWNLDQAVIHINPTSLLQRETSHEISVYLIAPAPLVARVVKSNVVLLPPFDHILDNLTTSSVSGRWRLSSLVVSDGTLRALLPPTSRKKDRRIEVSIVRSEFQSDPEAAYRSLSIFGEAGVTRGSAFRAWIVQRGETCKLRGFTDPFQFHLPNVDPDLSDGAVDSMRIGGTLKRVKSGAWNYEVSARSPSVKFSDVTEVEPVATASGRFDPKSLRGALSLDVASRASRVELEADLRLGAREDSSTTISIERIAEGWFRLWNRRRYPPFPSIEGANAAITLSAQARLLRQAPWITQPRARLRLRGADLQAEHLPLDVEDVRLDAEFTEDGIVLHDCGGRWGRGWVQLRGGYAGPWFGRIAGKTTIDWSFDCRAEDVLTTLPVAAESALSAKAIAAYANRPQLEGDLAGSGTLSLQWAGAEELEMPTTRTLQGTLVLRNGRIDHPRLPSPVTGIDAMFELSPQRLEIREVQGTFLDTTATISASVVGRPFFWNAPQTQCFVETQFPIAQAVQYIPEAYRPRVEALSPQGTIHAAVGLSGPLRRPLRTEDIKTTGVFRLADGGFDSTFYGLDGRFHDLRLQADFDGRAVRLTTGTGMIENVPFSLSGEADLQDNRLWTRFDSGAPMSAYQRILRRALSRWEVAGSASGWLRLEAHGEDLFRKGIQIEALTSETLAALPFSWDLTGEVLVHDVKMTLETFPTSLTQINGTMRLHNFNWTFTDVTSAWGKTEDCRVTGGGVFRPGNWPRMHIELEAPVVYLDEWIRPWRRSSGSRFESRVKNPVFEMTGVIRGKRAFYRGHPGENLYGEIAVVTPREDVDTFWYKNARTDLYEGRLLSQGVVEFDHGRSTSTLEFTADDISLPPLLQCETGREQTFAGHLNGYAKFHWLGGDIDSLVGNGNLDIRESRFFGNVFFRNLGRLIRIPYLDNVSFAKIEGPIRLANRKVYCDKLEMDGMPLSLRGKGVVGFNHTLDFVLELGFVRLPRYARLLDLVVQSFGRIPATVFSLDLRGTWDDPQYSFHQLGVAEKSLLGAIDQVWGVVAPTPPDPGPDSQPPEE